MLTAKMVLLFVLVSGSPSNVEVGIPDGAGYGFTCVVVDGVKSNALPINLK